MLRSAPSFPPFEQWEMMSESDQDALLDRIETARRRKTQLKRACIGMAGALLSAGITAAVYVALAGGY